MSKEGEGGANPLGDFKGGIPGPSGFGQFDAGIFADRQAAADAAPHVLGHGIAFDASVLASILNQARGPTLDQMFHQLSPFAGDGALEITEWLLAYKRLCEVEHVAPTDLLTYMLPGNTARVYCRMTMGEASDWKAVKAVLTAEYAMPRQEAWRRYVTCKLEAGETVDVYLGPLE